MIVSIVQHELKQLINNSKAWYLLAVIQTMLAILFKWLVTNFLKYQAITEIPHYGITEEVIHPFYGWVALMLLIFLPMVTAQAFCAEKQNGTIRNYYCAPITGLQLLLGKFISLNIAMLFILLIASLMPITILISGNLDLGQFAAVIIGVYLMLSAALATGLGVSMHMNNILRANITIFLIITMFIMLEWAAQYTVKYSMFLQEFGLLSPLKMFLSGILSTRHIAYYLLIITVFLLLGAWRYSREVNNA